MSQDILELRIRQCFHQGYHAVELGLIDAGGHDRNGMAMPRGVRDGIQERLKRCGSNRLCDVRLLYPKTFQCDGFGERRRNGGIS